MNRNFKCQFLKHIYSKKKKKKKYGTMKIWSSFVREVKSVGEEARLVKSKGNPPFAHEFVNVNDQWSVGLSL